jgi:coenzyme F420-reducing hydrogenase gamma subunit
LQGNDKKSINDWSVAKVQNIRNKKSLVVQLGKNTTTGGYRGWQGHHSCDWIDSGWYLKSRLV